jgi:hypothetical protein
MLCEIISHIGVTWRPTNVELVLLHSVLDPVDSHIHFLRAFLLHCVIDNTICCGVFSFEFCGVVVVTHFSQCCACDGAFLRIHKKGTKLGLSNRGYHMFEDYCVAQKWAIREGFLGGVCFVPQVEVTATSLLSLGLREVRGITVNLELHVRCKVSDKGFIVSDSVVKDM